MSDREFDQLLTDARALIEADITRERCEVEPDFTAVVTLAHERSPEQVSASAVVEAEALAPVVSLRRVRADEPRMLDDDQLDALLTETRELVEQDVSARRMAEIPPLWTAAPTRVRRSTTPLRWVAGIVGLVVMMSGIAVAAPRLLESLRWDQHSEPTQRPLVERREIESATEQRAGTEDAADAPEADDASPPEPEVDDAGAPEIDSSPLAVAPRPETPSKRSSAARDRKRPSIAERVAELDDEAQARWAEGDLDGATEAFRAIIELAGKSRYADLAYGDLFTLARQRGDHAAEQKLWREYLGEFPSGRFADDARAGLCRRADSGERARCWQSYLDDFPKGVHRQTAERALDSEDPSSQNH